MKYVLKPFDYEAIAEEYPERAEEIQQSANAVMDEGLANWMVKKVIEIQKEYQHLRETTDAEIKQDIKDLENQIARLQEEEERKTSWFTYKLREFMEQSERTRHLKTKDDLKLARGVLTVSRKEPKFIRPAAEADGLKEFVEKHYPEYLVTQTKTTETVEWGKIKKIFVVEGSHLIDPKTDQEVPGVMVEHREPEFTVAPMKSK